MPELPEVETTMRFLKGRLLGQEIADIYYSGHSLRRPLDLAQLKKILCGQSISKLQRRGKYIILSTSQGHALIHLGMSGRILLKQSAQAEEAHTHVILTTRKDTSFHYIDPRRFGLVEAYITRDPLHHPLLRNLGVEPLSQANLGDYLWQKAQKRNTAIKTFLMDAKIVVGVGNIYAAESLFRAGIHPLRPARKIALRRYQRLGEAIRFILKRSIKAGGTSIKDFVSGEGRGGYYAIKLDVYGREGESCHKCNAPIKQVKQTGRSSWYCPRCQR